MRVNQLAALAEVSEHSVRYYTRIGLLHPRKNAANGYREFNQNDLKRLNFIVYARQLGFSIADIKLIVSEAEKGKSPCPKVRELIAQRLGETEKRFNETAALRTRMTSAIKQWRSKPDKIPTGDMICHLIEEFEVTPE